MKVAVFGASGKVGRLIVQRLLSNGDEVVAFVHNQAPFPDDTPGLKIVKGDVHNLVDVKRAVKGTDKVVSALGSWGTKQKDIVSSGTDNIISAMSAYHVERIVSLTGSEAWLEGDKINLWNRITHGLVKCTPVRKILADGEAHLRSLQDSQLDWTVLRSPIMNSWGQPSSFQITNRRPAHWMTVNRQSVAAGMVQLLDAKGYARQAPYIWRQPRG